MCPNLSVPSSQHPDTDSRKNWRPEHVSRHSHADSSSRVKGNLHRSGGKGRVQQFHYLRPPMKRSVRFFPLLKNMNHFRKCWKWKPSCFTGVLQTFRDKKSCLDIVPQSCECRRRELSYGSCVFVWRALAVLLRSPGRLALGVSVEGDRYVGSDNQITVRGHHLGSVSLSSARPD